MRKAELISQERARARAYTYAYWIVLFGTVGGILAAPHLRDLSPTLASLTGNSWLVLFIVGLGLVTIFNRSKMTRCPRCRRALNGPIAIATDRCSRCGEIAVDDPRST